MTKYQVSHCISLALFRCKLYIRIRNLFIENERWSLPIGIIDKDGGISPGVDTEQVFEEIFRRYSVEGLIDEVGDEIFEHDDGDRLGVNEKSNDVEIIDGTHVKGL